MHIKKESIGNATLYLGDCLEVMPTLDTVFDLAIVDPPYNVGACSGTFGNRGYDSATSGLKKYANHNKTPNSDYFEQLRKISKNQIVWGANYYPQYFSHTGAIVWHKKNDGPLSDCEIAFQSFDKRVKYFWSEWQGFLKGGERGKRIHPNQKPVALYRWLLENYAQQQHTIIDTHLGSGSCVIACVEIGLKVVGIELDEEYFNAACNRIEQAQKQGKLFTRQASSSAKAENLHIWEMPVEGNDKNSASLEKPSSEK